MRSYRHPDFHKAFAQLPDRVKDSARKAYALFRDDPYHNSLHFKRLKGTDIYSVRIGSNYRALAFRKGDEVVWFWIGTHDEYDKLIKGF